MSGISPTDTPERSERDPVSVVPVVPADSEPGPVLAEDLLQLGGVLR